MSWLGEAVHQTILALDIEGPDLAQRPDSERPHTPTALCLLLEQALGRARIEPADYERSDQPDGTLLLLRQQVPSSQVFPWVILRLAAALERRNQNVPPASRLRVRAVIHAGEVARDGYGYASKDLNLVFRLLHSNLLRSYLWNTTVSLVLLVSDPMHSDIVERDARAHDAAAFQPVHVVAEGAPAFAWVYIPGRHNAAAGEGPRSGSPAATAAAPVPRQLLAEVPGFAGREAELRWLLATLGRGDAAAPTVAAIHGVEGVGKSALAVHAGHRLASRFPDGQLYVNLQGATTGLPPLAPGEAVARLLRALGVDGRDVPLDAGQGAARFRSLLAGRRVLVLLDNAASADQVRPLLPADPTAAALITSRQPLTSLDGTSQLHLEVLPLVQAIGLLAQLAGAARLAAEPRAAEELARYCEQLPLALRIAGGCLAARPGWPVRTLAERLAVERARLRAPEREAADLAVRSCFQASYQALDSSDDQLDRQAARLFRLLGLHRGADIGAWTAAALLQTPAALAAAAAPLERLVAAQLLEVPAPHRYRLHALLLPLARERANHEEPKQRDAAVRRMLHFYLRTAHHAQRLLQPTAFGGSRWQVEADTQPLADRAQGFAWFEQERANLLAAAHQAADGPGPLAQVAVRLAEVMFWFFELRAYWRDSEEVNQLAAAVAERRGDRYGQAVALNDLGFANIGMGRLDQAIPCLERSHGLFHEQGDRLWEGLSLMGLGTACREDGQVERAVDCLKRGLAAIHETGSRTAEALALNSLALAYCDQRRFDAATDCLERSLGFRCELRDRYGQATTLSRLGEVHYRAGRAPVAVESYELSLQIFRDMGERRREAETLWRLGHAHDALGQPGRARVCWRAARAIFKEMGVPATDEEFRRTTWV
jgi:tetratricopeptide (TPR) repeat protein